MTILYLTDEDYRVIDSGDAAAIKRHFNQVRGELTEYTWDFVTLHPRCAGCGQEFTRPGQMYRCVDCHAPYHRHCLRAHCGGRLEQVEAERDTLRLELAQARAKQPEVEVDRLLGHMTLMAAREEILIAERDKALARAEASEAQVSILCEVLSRVEHGGRDGTCPVCGSRSGKNGFTPHAPDCPLVQALGRE